MCFVWTFVVKSPPSPSRKTLAAIWHKFAAYLALSLVYLRQCFKPISRWKSWVSKSQMKFLMAQRSFNSVKEFALNFCRFWRFWLKIFRWNFFAGFESAKKKNQEKLKRLRNINRLVWTENESLSFLCLLSSKKLMK